MISQKVKYSSACFEACDIIHTDPLREQCPECCLFSLKHEAQLLLHSAAFTLHHTLSIIHTVTGRKYHAFRFLLSPSRVYVYKVAETIRIQEILQECAVINVMLTVFQSYRYEQQHVVLGGQGLEKCSLRVVVFQVEKYNDSDLT